MAISKISPNINVFEFDYSTSNPTVEPFSTCMVGQFIWGPCFQRKQVTTEAELVNYFGKPNETNYEEFFNAQRYLSYTNNLWVVRTVDADTAKNAGIQCTDDTYGSDTLPLTSNPYIPNTLTTVTNSFGTHEKLRIVAKYPGTFGNTKIKVALANATDFPTADINDSYSFKGVFEYAPTVHDTYDYYDQVAIVVQIQNLFDDNWTIVEKFVVDLDPTAKNAFKKSNYIENIINTQSRYIYVYDNTDLLVMPNSFEETLLSGGVDSEASTADYELAYDYYANAEEFPVRYIMDANNNSVTIQKYIVSLLETRLDCFGILCVPKDQFLNVDLSTAVNNAVTYRNTTLASNTSYASLYGNAAYVFDKYNDKYRWVSLSGDVAGIIVLTNLRKNIWDVPAGRDIQLQNVERLAIEPNLAYRDEFYINNINPIITISGEGIQLFGQKTLQNFSSSFDRLNVRLLFLEMEQTIKKTARGTLFKINNDFQRNLFKLSIIPYFEQIEAAGGIYEFKVVCDETNNTAQIIDTHNFVVDIYIKPAMSIEIVNINFTAVGSGIAISEIIASK